MKNTINIILNKFRHLVAIFSLLFVYSLSAQTTGITNDYEDVFGPIKSIMTVEYADSVGGNFNGRTLIEMDTFGLFTKITYYRGISGDEIGRYEIPTYHFPHQRSTKRQSNLMTSKFNYFHSSFEESYSNIKMYSYEFKEKHRIKKITDVAEGGYRIEFYTHYYNQDSIIILTSRLVENELKQEELHKTVIIKKGDLIYSFGVYIGDYPILYYEYQYEAFDANKNWTIRRATCSGIWDGKLFSGIIVQKRNITYYP